MVDFSPAIVLPRCRTPDDSGPLLLQDEVLVRIDAHKVGLIELLGPPGSGKSIAIAHLAFLYRDNPFLIPVDQPDADWLAELSGAATDHLVIYASPSSAGSREAERWRLTPWTKDDCIEYLLSAHRDQCASVMRRVQSDADWSWLGGTAALCRIALDRLALDEGILAGKSALRHELLARMATSSSRRAACEFCAASFLDIAEEAEAAISLRHMQEIDATVLVLMRYGQVKMLLAAESLASRLKARPKADILGRRLPQELVLETAALLRDDRPVLARLQKILTRRNRTCHATAASLLHAAGVNWIPAGRRVPMLSGAQLAGIRWPGVRLTRLDLSGADLTGADLSEANLPRLCADRTRLCHARLHGASLEKASAVGAVLSGADLTCIRAAEADFRLADLSDANLEGALLTAVNFDGANFRGARCCRANLRYADLRGSQLEDANFEGADLSWALLGKLALRVAGFTGAVFVQSQLVDCDLEYMRLPGANFEKAVLRGAHLTGSQMPNARFHRADLKSTGLAEIEWERADLREADLRGCTFHLGSSRSGLVGSPIASEGSRTGFYTDEFNEQDFKSPEEIRKANLCGADLRGAKISNVDFYLVDLRGARYTEDQESHFRRCGAILETRV